MKGLLGALSLLVALGAGPSAAADSREAPSWLEGMVHAVRAALGHWGVLRAARPIEEWLNDPQTPEALKQRLLLARALRQFAVEALALPDSPSYRHYANIGRPAVVWNVVAAPPDRLELKTWCYPVAGCVGYRGYFEEAQAQSQARVLASQGWEVHVYPVRAYSTLGRTAWLGGDPLLNTFALGHPLDLASLLFHEMAHERLYVTGDLAFNESYASAVEQLGVQQWRATYAAAAGDVQVEAQVQVQVQAETWDRLRQQRAALMKRVNAYRDALQNLYARASPWAEEKRQLREAFERDYVELRDRHWGGDRRWDTWVAGLNNAALALLGGYHDGVPAFERLFKAVDGDWPRFHQAVEVLARRPTSERQAWLQGHPLPAGVLDGP